MLMPVSEYLEHVTMDRTLRIYLERKYNELDISYSMPLIWNPESEEYWFKHICKTKADCDKWLKKAVKYDKIKKELVEMIRQTEGSCAQ
jgi:hypothetical protein